MFDQKTVMTLTSCIVLMFCTNVQLHAGWQQEQGNLQDQARQGQQRAQRNERCGRAYNDCQSQCVFVEMSVSYEYNNNGTPKCNNKNNRVSQCRNSCYQQHTNCVGAY